MRRSTNLQKLCIAEVSSLLIVDKSTVRRMMLADFLQQQLHLSIGWRENCIGFYHRRRWCRHSICAFGRHWGRRRKLFGKHLLKRRSLRPQSWCFCCWWWRDNNESYDENKSKEKALVPQRSWHSDDGISSAHEMSSEARVSFNFERYDISISFREFYFILFLQQTCWVMYGECQLVCLRKAVSMADNGVLYNSENLLEQLMLLPSFV